MIKIKLTNWELGRNKSTWLPFLIYSKYFYEAGIVFVEDGSYDIEFVGMNDFIDKQLPLEDSIKEGLKNLEDKEGSYYLFDGSDSTSLMGAYEVLASSNAKCLFKNQILKRENYKKASAFNKWFFGDGSNLDLGYDIPSNVYENKIKLTGWNLGFHPGNYHNFIDRNTNKDIDVCAAYHAEHPENYDHGVRNDTYYTSHRTAPWKMFAQNKKINSVTERLESNEYFDALHRSKMVLSPFGMGEVCHRDFEIIQHGSVIVKPDMSNVITKPNIYVPMETYVPVKLDWSDLEEKVEFVLDNPEIAKDIAQNARDVFKKEYTVENLLNHWKETILTFEGAGQSENIDQQKT